MPKKEKGVYIVEENMNIEQKILQSNVLLSICAMCMLFVSILVCMKLYEEKDM